MVWCGGVAAAHGTARVMREAVDDNDVTRVQEEASTPTPQSASYHNRRAVLVTLESESSLWISPSNPSDKGPYVIQTLPMCTYIFGGKRTRSAVKGPEKIFFFALCSIRVIADP